MSGLREALTSYLSLRRGMGFKLDRDEKMTCIGLLGSLAAELEALLRCAGRPPQLRRVTINRVSNPRAGRWCAPGSLRRSRCLS